MNREKFAGYSLTDYIREAEKASGAKNDSDLAKKLNITRSALSNYKSGARIMDDYCAMQVAGILEIDPMLVIAKANEMREKSEPRRNFWRDIQISLTLGSGHLVGKRVVPRGGIEPPTRGFSIHCSTD